MNQNSHQQTSDNRQVTSQPERKKSWLRRYFAVPTLAGLGLMVYLIFFGENSMVERVAFQHKIDSLTECLKREQDSLSYYRILNERLSKDPVMMEKVVREQYNMNKINEDVYVIENE